MKNNNEVLTPHTSEPIMQQNKETQNLSPLKANNLSMKDPIALKEVEKGSQVRAYTPKETGNPSHKHTG